MPDADGFANLEPRAWLDAAAFALLTVATAVPLWLPLQTIAQATLSTIIGTTALSAWLRQRRTRVSALRLGQDRKRLRIRTSTGDWLGVIRVDAGVIGPSLVSVQLVTDAGRTLTLFLPRGALPSEVHRKLCRLLLASRHLTDPTSRQSSREPGT